MTRSVAPLLGAVLIPLALMLTTGRAEAVDSYGRCFEDDNTVLPPIVNPTCPLVDVESLDPVPTNPDNFIG